LITSSSPGVILHVDDDPGMRDSLSLALKLSGFDVHLAADAASALSSSTSLRDVLDVLIVDYHLGEETTGTDVAEEVSRLLGRSLPTVILTGDPANAQIPVLNRAPVWLVRKPLDMEVLVAALPALVEFQRAVRRFGVAR
jgi:DNA-binding response OmpR family regulator